MKSKTDPIHPLMRIKKQHVRDDLFREFKNELMEVATDPKLNSPQTREIELVLSYIDHGRYLMSFESNELVKKAFNKACAKVADQTWKEEFHSWVFNYSSSFSSLSPDGCFTD